MKAKIRDINSQEFIKNARGSSIGVCGAHMWPLLCELIQGISKFVSSPN